MASAFAQEVEYHGIETSSVQSATGVDTELFISTLGNLIRLGLIQRVFEKAAIIWGNPPLGSGEKDMAGLTPLGYGFLRSCIGPQSEVNAG